LRERIYITARATAQVQNPHTFKRIGRDQPAAVIARQHLIVDARQQVFKFLRHIERIATRIGLEVRAALQHFPVILFYTLVAHHMLRSLAFAAHTAAKSPKIA